MVTTEDLARQPLLIGGEWKEAASGKWLENIDPCTGQVMGYVAAGGTRDIDQAIQVAREAFESKKWRSMKPAERGRLLIRLASLIRANAEALTELEVRDTGKAKSVVRNDVSIAADYYEYYGGYADKIQGETIPASREYLNYTLREPRGVCGIIAPWNFPIQTSSRGLAPALAAGNVVVLKPAEEACLSAMRLGGLALEAGFPPGIVNIVSGAGEEAGAALSSHPGIDHITFTGSIETGILVTKAAAQNVVPVVLELGGKGPNIVFDDANLEAAAAGAARTAFRVSGQSCSNGSRLLVHESIADRFLDRVRSLAAAMRVGPGEEDPDLGPLISERQFDRVWNYIQIGRQEGAHIVTGGDRPSEERLRRGFFIVPTIFDSVRPDMRVFQEEIFGPVLVATTFRSDEEAIALANNSSYGLTAGVWTENLGRAHRLARELQAGQVYVNNWAGGTGVASPFGGYKKSGFGREKGLETFHHYTTVKAVSILIGN